MRRLHLAVAIAILVFPLAPGRPAPAGELPRAQPDQVGLDAAKLEQASALFRDAVDKKEIAGAVLLVARHGKVAYLEAVGKQDVEAGVAMSPESIFRIASMTKPITSTAAMILVDQGRLDLSDPISKYLPEFKFMKVAMPRKVGPAAVAGQSGRGVRPGPGLSADHGPRPADAHLGHLLPVHRSALRRPALRRGGDLRRPDRPARSRWPRTSAGSPPCPCTTSPARPGNTASTPTSWAGSSRSSRASRWMPSSPSGSSGRSRWTTRISSCPRPSATAWPRSMSPGRTARSSGPADGPTVKGALIYSADAAYRQRHGLFLGRRGPALDRRRLRPVPPDDAQPRRAGRRPRAPSPRRSTP